MVEMEVAKVAVFEGKRNRKILHEGECWFSIIDIVQVLAGSSMPKRYWSVLKRKLRRDGYSELYEKLCIRNILFHGKTSTETSLVQYSS